MREEVLRSIRADAARALEAESARGSPAEEMEAFRESTERRIDPSRQDEVIVRYPDCFPENAGFVQFVMMPLNTRFQFSGKLWKKTAKHLAQDDEGKEMIFWTGEDRGIEVEPVASKTHTFFRHVDATRYIVTAKDAVSYEAARLAFQNYSVNHFALPRCAEVTIDFDEWFPAKQYRTGQPKISE
jgi:hypothetical protein